MYWEKNMGVTSIRINEDLEPLINEFIKENQRTKNWIINEALRIFFESKSIQEQRWKGIVKGIADLKEGNIVEGSEVDAWLASWGSENERNAP